MANEIFDDKAIGAKFSTTELAGVIAWTFDGSAELADSTVAHATNLGRTRVAGLKTATATVTTLFTADAAPQVLITTPVTAATLLLKRHTATNAHGYYSGSAKCTSHSYGANLDGLETITYHFQYVAVVTIAVAAY